MTASGEVAFATSALPEAGPEPVVAEHVGPSLRDPVLLFDLPWLQCILDGRKTLELRGFRVKNGPSGRVWLGVEDRIHAAARVDAAGPLTLEEYLRQAPQHLHPSKTLPFKTTWGLMLTNVQKLSEPLWFHRPPSSARHFSYRPPPEDGNCSSKKKRRVLPLEAEHFAPAIEELAE
ncbi:unnamed protein product [Effrenium voratum]|nr:unnamed protein product [Effrenium voratum]